MTTQYQPTPSPDPTSPAPAPAPAPVSPSSRRAWRIGGSVLAVLLLAATVAQVVSLIGWSSESVRRSVPAAGIDEVSVDAGSGDVSITGTDDDEIRIVARVSHGLLPTRLRVVERSGTLSLGSDCPLLSRNCTVDFTVEVPRDRRVVVRSDNGDVDARDLRGGARLSSDNGAVVVSDLAGTTVLRSDNGDVRAQRLETDDVDARSGNGDVLLHLATPPLSLHAESDNGDVTVELPRSEHSYALDLFSSKGDRVADVRTDPGSDRRLVVRSDNGDATVRYRLR